jgi:RND family efflux transporter MFP subunit
MENIQSYNVVFDAITLLKQRLQEIADVQSLVEKANYTQAAEALLTLIKDMEGSEKWIQNASGHIVTFTWSYPDIATSIDFQNMAKNNMERIRVILQKPNSAELELQEALQTAQHDLETSNAILQANQLVGSTGLSLKAYQQSDINLRTAKANLLDTMDTITRTEILAPFDGTVVSVAVKEDDVLSDRDYSAITAVRIVDTSSVRFEGTVDEIDIFQVKVGQKATILVDALPNQELTGKVSFIAPSSTGAADIVSYAIVIELDKTNIELRGGLTSTAEIMIDSRANVLIIPVQAIVKTPEGTFVDVVLDEKKLTTARRPVTIGLQSYQFAEVMSGLKEGDKVLYIEKIGAQRTQQGFQFLRR